jgi:hypothetical protein
MELALKWGGGGERWLMYSSVFKRLPLHLIDGHNKRDFVGNRVLHSLKGMVESDGHN